MTFVMWITGLPGSGKTTIAKEVVKLLNRQKKKVVHLRLDDIRKKLTPKPTYSKAERDKVYKFLAQSAALLYSNKVNALVDATDNLNIGRDMVRKLVHDFYVVQLECPIDMCVSREENRKDNAGLKDLYKKARSGKIKLPGLNDKYIEEKKPFIRIDTKSCTPIESAKLIVKSLP